LEIPTLTYAEGNAEVDAGPFWVRSTTIATLSVTFNAEDTSNHSERIFPSFSIIKLKFIIFRKDQTLTEKYDLLGLFS